MKFKQFDMTTKKSYIRAIKFSVYCDKIKNFGVTNFSI